MAYLNQTVAPLSTIISWFAEDAVPTDTQFETTWKSFFHKSENIPVDQIYQLSEILNLKAERDHLHLDLAKKDGSNLSSDDINGLKEVLGVALAANGIINNIEPTITSEEANVLQDGIYKPKITGVYTSIGLTAQENYTTLFKKLDGLWSIFSEEKLPVLETVDKVEKQNQLPVISGAVYDEFEPLKSMLGSVRVETEGENQYTTSGNAVTSSVGSVHGYSFPCGLISLPFSKVTVYYAQNIATPISEVEIRLFKINASGELIIKKRIAFTPDLTVQTSVEIPLDTILDLSEKIWCQVLMNNPFAIRRVSPAVIFTTANGYESPKATTINNLDGTTFSTSQSAVDVLLTFNSVISSVADVDFTAYGKEKVKEIIASETQSDMIEIPMIWNCIGHSIWAQDQIVYNNSQEIANGIQTWIRTFFAFKGYNKLCYSGRSLGATSESDKDSITYYFSTWLVNSSYKYFWTYDSITNDFKRNIPLGNISDYNNNTGALTYYGALRLLVEKIRELTPNTIVICANAMERNNGGYTTNSINTVGSRLIDYELALMEIASINNWLFVDQKRNSGIYEENLTKTTRDGLHPNDFGYSLCFKPWYDILKKLKTLI